DAYKGTGRSVSKVDIFRMLDKYRDQFLRFGGHSAACGFMIEGDKIEALRDALNQDLLEMTFEDETLFDEELEYDLSIEPEQATMELAEALHGLEPCGKSNEAPVIRFSSVEIRDWFCDVKYARFTLPAGNTRLDCRLFRDLGKYSALVQEGGRFDVYGTLEINTWRNSSKVQMLVRRMVPAGEDY
ncbi:MAG: hypothetical protein IJH77_06390, partial [Mogibacterium sp.]|nr:hypothetical protein [Mogibacterium sp.]